jgi:hypothetical protein
LRGKAVTDEPVDLPLPNETLQQTAQRMTIAFNALCKEFAGNTLELRAQKKYGRHTRFGMYVAIISLLIDLPITGLLLLSYSSSQDAVRIANLAAQTSARTAQEDLYTNCLKGNTSRNQEAALFNDILVGVAPTIGPAETMKFAKLITTTFKLRNCNLLKPKNGAPSESAHSLGSVGPWLPLTLTSSVETTAKTSPPRVRVSCKLPVVPVGTWIRITPSLGN